MQKKRSTIREVPRGVWTLGFVSMLMDVSSEMVHSLLPIFLMSNLGASAALVGLIEGISEATASITKVFSGYLSDSIGKRKTLVLIGYGLAALTKPWFAIATTSAEVLAARFADRIGKGIRGAPRDALIADLTPDNARGAAFGIRQGLDTVGAFLGPGLAVALMWLYADDIRAVFMWAIVPAVACVALLFFGVEEPQAAAAKATRVPLAWPATKQLGGKFWVITGIGAVFTLARFSEAFLVLRAQNVGLPIALAPLVMIAMNVVYATLSAPIGALSDRIGRYGLLGLGLFVLITADLVLGLWTSIAGVFIGAGLWGLHMGLTQGLLSALVADAAPVRLRGTAFGVFNLIGGLALLAASLIAGLMWQAIGPQATFLVGAAFAALSLVALGLYWRN